MTNEQFDRLVHRLEPLACRMPRLYCAGVISLAVLGNLYLAVVLLLLFASVLALTFSVIKLKALAIKLLIPLACFTWLIVKALWVRISPPSGIAVVPDQAPRLFELIENVRGQLASPRFHVVLISDEFNACVCQVPRLGILGWPRNYLVLGLPLMKTLSVDQFTVVLAHEFGHLANNHGRSSRWVYSQRCRWQQLSEAFEAEGKGGRFLFVPLLKWFAPLFSACSFPLARAKEYEADAQSARLTSFHTAAQALASIKVTGAFIHERFWPAIYDEADSRLAPERLPYAALAGALKGGITSQDADRWLERELKRETDTTDSHPALRDRLAALHDAPCFAQPSGASADSLLGDQLESITAQLDRAWWEDVKESWARRYKKVETGRAELADLEARVDKDEALTPEEALRRAYLTEDVAHKPAEALALFRASYACSPENARACFALGSRLLARDEAEGAPLLERAMALDDEATAACCELLRDYHWRGERKKDAHQWHERLTQRQTLDANEQHARSQVTLEDTFEPHGLSEETIALLRQQLTTDTHLRRAYLVRKKISRHPERPCWVFGFVATPPFHLFSVARVTKAVQDLQASVSLPEGTVLVNVENANTPFEAKLKRVASSQVL